MRDNPALLKGIADSATKEQRAAVHRLPRERAEMIARFGDTPMVKAWYIVQWLTRFGQNAARWSRKEWRGRVVASEDVHQLVSANKQDPAE